MDKNKFWLGGRLFNTASPMLGAPTQRKARPQVGRPNATQGTSGIWVPERTSATQTEDTSTRPQVGRPNATQGTSASWAPQRNARHVRKLGAPTHVRNANVRHVRMSAIRAPQRNARHVRKLGAQTQRKASLQDGRTNEKLICNENVHTREH
jgi:hypothetical protein